MEMSELKMGALRIASAHDHNSMRLIKFSSKRPLCTNKAAATLARFRLARSAAIIQLKGL